MQFLLSFAFVSLSVAMSFSSLADGFATLEEAVQTAKKAAQAHPQAFVGIWHAPSTRSGKMGIPTSKDAEYNVDIDWNYDGNIFVWTSAERTKWHPPVRLPYGNGSKPGWREVLPLPSMNLPSGRYLVTVVKGNIRHMTFKNYTGDVKNSLVMVINIGDLGYRSFARAFAGCTHLRKVLQQGSALVGTGVTDASEMFANIRGPGLSEITPRLRLHSTESVRGMFENTNFAGNGSIRLDHLLSQANRLRDMSRMFFKSNARNVLGLWGWRTPNVKTMSMMFLESHMQDYPGIGIWDVSNLEDMSYTFSTRSHANPLPRISGKWNTGKVKWMESAFAGVHFPAGTDNLGLDTSNVQSMRWMFAHSHNPPMRNFSTKNVRNMHGMYKDAKLGAHASSAFDGMQLGNLQTGFEIFRDAVRKRPYQVTDYTTAPYYIVEYYKSFLRALVRSGPRGVKVDLRKSGKCQKTGDEGKYRGWKDRDCLNLQEQLRNRGYDIPQTQAPTLPRPVQDPHA